MADLQDAILLAVKAHWGQKDKAGAPYILHPLAVMLRMNNEIEMMAAVLHDVIEDTDWDLDRLRDAGYPEMVLNAVDSLTKRETEDYDAYIERVRCNPLARKVKIADVEHNMDIRRIAEIGDRDVQRMKKYRRTWARLVTPD